MSVLQNHVLLKHYIMSGKMPEVGVSGESMVPFLSGSDKVRLGSLDETISVGEVVAYPGRRSKLPVLHRAIEVAGSKILVMGDNAYEASSVALSEIIGTVEGIQVNGLWHRYCKHDTLSQKIACLSKEINELFGLTETAFGNEKIACDARVHHLSEERRKLCGRLRKHIVSLENAKASPFPERGLT